MAKKRKKVIAGQTSKGPGRPPKDAPKNPGVHKHRKKNYWNKMHVRGILYRHYKTRYPDWKSTIDDANQVIDEMRAAGYKKATKAGIIKTISARRLQEIQAKKEAERKPESIEMFFFNEPQLLDPIPFYSIEKDLCIPWKNISNKVILWTKFIWPRDIVYTGGSIVPYNETFAEYCREMSKQQEKKRHTGDKEDYINSWFFRLRIESARWDPSLHAYFVEVITCNSDGEKVFYFGEAEEEMPKEPGKPGEVPPEPEKPTEEKPPVPPGERPPAGEFTPEQRVEIEKEKVRAEADAKAKYTAETEFKKEKLHTLKDLFEKGIISKEDFFEQFNKM